VRASTSANWTRFSQLAWLAAGFSRAAAGLAPTNTTSVPSRQMTDLRFTRTSPPMQPCIAHDADPAVTLLVYTGVHKLGYRAPTHGAIPSTRGAILAHSTERWDDLPVGEERQMGQSAETAFDAVATALLPYADVEEGTGFGTNPGLRTNGKIFAILHTGQLILKLPAGRCTALIATGEARAFQIGRRTMREWVQFASVDEQQWLALAREARSYVAGDPAGGGSRPSRGD
jgi:hypothetical protein